jgi:peptidoglycan-associated lipoprotein
MSGCPGPDYPKCENDDHCKKDKDGEEIDEVCVFGQCQECGRDEDCKAGQRCNANWRCEEPCKSNGDCGVGQRCEAGECKAECDDQNACAEGKECRNGRCLMPDGACVENGDCKSGFSCKAGVCVEGGDAEALICNKKGRVNFEFNLFDLRPDAQTELDNFAKCLKKNTGWKVTIEGHADERGSTEYNLSLGEKRARSVKEYLERLGVGKGRLKMVSYGEERPLDSRSNEAAWAQNRRAELVVK